MRASDNTIAYVKEWVAGRQKARQHMHYYIVNTHRASFLMKKNDQPDLVAIRDHRGHIFIIDNAPAHYSITSEYCQRNPLLAMIGDGVKFPYSLLPEGSFSDDMKSCLSSWGTLDTKKLTHQSNSIEVELSLITIGDKLYTTEVSSSEKKATRKLTEWANFEDITNGNLKPTEGFRPMLALYETPTKAKTVDGVRQAYVDFAGEGAESAIIAGEWVYIPTPTTSIDQVIKEKFSEVIRTRPCPQQYCIPPELIDANKAWQRTEYPFDVATLDTYDTTRNVINLNFIPDKHHFLRSGDKWGEYLGNRIDPDIAQAIADFMKADDEWLKKYSHIVAPIAMGRVFRDRFREINPIGWVVVVREDNPSIMSQFVTYVKGVSLDSYGQKVTIKCSPNFVKVIPSAVFEGAYSIKEFMKHVCI